MKIQEFKQQSDCEQLLTAPRKSDLDIYCVVQEQWTIWQSLFPAYIKCSWQIPKTSRSLKSHSQVAFSKYCSRLRKPFICFLFFFKYKVSYVLQQIYFECIQETRKATKKQIKVWAFYLLNGYIRPYHLFNIWEKHIAKVLCCFYRKLSWQIVNGTHQNPRAFHTERENMALLNYFALVPERHHLSQVL